MTFGDIPAGASLFIDANTFVYHFTPHPVFRPACEKLIERIELRELTAFTSTHVLTDLAHRMMTIEAIRRNGWPSAGIVRRLRKHPDEIKRLALFRQVIDEIPLLGIQVLVSSAASISSAAALSQQHGLLSGDALIAAIMQQVGLSQLASHDADFDRVPGLVRYAPA
ncbi:MAG TPA: PIN domain-containing protein [Pirellulales bacterium]|nr:PIN domain-containing protein [Pirellulales bacterium]